jgi:hypothetical protein
MTAHRILGLLYAFAVAKCICERIPVPINANCSFHSSLGSVTHDTDARQIIIDMHTRRRCENPTFHVRLSGTALYLLNLVKHDYAALAERDTYSFISRRKNTYYFSYPELQDSGTYFLEILILFCGGFDPLNFENVCIEDHWHDRNVVNQPYSFEYTRPVTMNTAAKRPRWLLQHGDNLPYAPSLLPTRYQHRYCGEQQLCEHEHLELELWQYKLYDFVDAPDWRGVYSRLLERLRSAPSSNASTASSTTTVCFVGASHARDLTLHAQNLTARDPSLQFEHVEAKYPVDFSAALLRATYPCDYAVIGFGQWPVSWATPHPCNSECYLRAMKTVIGSITKSAYQGPVRVFMRSVNYNGMGTVVTACPPYDHRSPPVIDMMNHILVELTAAHGVDYIDLNHIMGPMWDSALDYCHPRGKVFTAEAEWVLNHIFTAALHALEASPGDAGSGAPAPPAAGPSKLVRFTDSAVVYLVQDGVARVIPNGHTFMAMGFEWGDVVVLTADKRALYSFGPDLPNMR